jgi:hypothetical protein
LNDNELFNINEMICHLVIINPRVSDKCPWNPLQMKRNTTNKNPGKKNPGKRKKPTIRVKLKNERICKTKMKKSI